MKAEKSYSVLTQKTIYKATKVEVDECSVLLPNGNKVEWSICVFPDILFAVPVQSNKVWMVREWRLGPKKIMTQFTGARCIHKSFQDNLKELTRELKEEQGIVKPKFTKLLETPQASHIQGNIIHVLVEDFKTTNPQREENEIQQMIQLPIKNLYTTLQCKHCATAETLLVAKLLEEKYLH
jgi:hypothetical protein